MRSPSFNFLIAADSLPRILLSEQDEKRGILVFFSTKVNIVSIILRKHSGQILLEKSARRHSTSSKKLSEIFESNHENCFSYARRK